MTDTRDLPGEDGPLAMRHGGEPITAEEALGVARRHARTVGETRAKRGAEADVPKVLPAVDEKKVPVLFRLPPRALAFARARAEMEHITLTQAVEEALEAYGRGVPGSRVTYQPPRR